MIRQNSDPNLSSNRGTSSKVTGGNSEYRIILLGIQAPLKSRRETTRSNLVHTSYYSYIAFTPNLGDLTPFRLELATIKWISLNLSSHNFLTTSYWRSAALEQWKVTKLGLCKPY